MNKRVRDGLLTILCFLEVNDFEDSDLYLNVDREVVLEAIHWIEARIAPRPHASDNMYKQNHDTIDL